MVFSELEHIFHFRNVKLKCFSVYLMPGKSLFAHKIPRQQTQGVKKIFYNFLKLDSHCALSGFGEF